MIKFIRHIRKGFIGQNKAYNLNMDGFNIIMVIAIILFARLAIRLLTGYKKLKKEMKDDKEKADDKTL